MRGLHIRASLFSVIAYFTNSTVTRLAHYGYAIKRTASGSRHTYHRIHAGFRSTTERPYHTLHIDSAATHREIFVLDVALTYCRGVVGPLAPSVVVVVLVVVDVELLGLFALSLA